jgi:hypothetical protein
LVTTTTFITARTSTGARPSAAKLSTLLAPLPADSTTRTGTSCPLPALRSARTVGAQFFARQGSVTVTIKLLQNANRRVDFICRQLTISISIKNWKQQWGCRYAWAALALPTSTWADLATELTPLSSTTLASTTTRRLCVNKRVA